MKQYYPVVLLCLLSIVDTVRGQSIAYSELNYNSDSTTTSGDWIELFNYGSTTLDISGWYIKDDDDLNVFTIPANTLLQPGSRIVVINDTDKFQSSYPFVTNYIGEMSFNLGNDGDQVRLFDNSGVLKLFMEYADSTPWYTAADGSGRTMEMVDALLDPNNPANWFVGCMFGSPGTAYVACNDPLVFGEINYNSDTLLDAGDWCEIWNRSSGYINLTGWSFKDSNDDNVFSFPNNINLAPDARLVLVHDTVRFLERHPDAINYTGNFDFNLSNDGELIRIFDFNGKLKFSVVFNDAGGGWPPEADGDGYTLELLDPLQNMNLPSGWFTGCPEGSPAYAYDPDCNVGIAEVTTDPLQILPSLTDRSITVEFPAPATSALLEVFDLTGNKLQAFRVSGNSFRMDVNHFARGMYIIALRNDASLVTGKFIVQ